MTVLNPSSDRRALRTRRLLKEALFALTIEKGYDAVTIEDITNRADLGRTTFYLHYKDKEELLLESIDSIAAELMARLPPPDWRVTVRPHSGSEMVQDAILVTFLHAAENASFYRIILRGEGATKANNRVHTIISQKAAALLAESIEARQVEPCVPVEVYANYFAGAMLALINWWLNANMPYPPEQMAEMFRMMFFQGGIKVLGVE